MENKTNLNKSKSIKLNLGCGVQLVSGFINVDKYLKLSDLKSKKGQYANAVVPKGAKFIQADAADLPFKDNSVDYIESIDMIEHMPTKKVIKVFMEIYRVLKPGGKLKMMTNDFDSMAKMWLDYMAKPGFTQEQYFEFSELIYGNQVGPGEYHTSPFNPMVMNGFITSVGLTLDKMTIYPFGTLDYPKNSQTMGPPMMNGRMRCDMIWAEAHK